jgi:hypothetical protein
MHDYNQAVQQIVPPPLTITDKDVDDNACMLHLFLMMAV